MKNTTINFEIKNTKTNIVTTIVNGDSKTITTKTVANESIIYMIEEYVKAGVLVTIETVVKGNKAADTLAAAVVRLESKFDCMADFINGAYMALINKPNLSIS